jgi:hypothetical protein
MTKPAHVVSTCNLLLFAERHRTRFADGCGRDCGRQNGDEQKAHANHGFPLEQIGYRRSAPALKERNTESMPRRRRNVDRRKRCCRNFTILILASDHHPPRDLSVGAVVRACRRKLVNLRDNGDRSRHPHPRHPPKTNRWREPIKRLETDKTIV